MTTYSRKRELNNPTKNQLNPHMNHSIIGQRNIVSISMLHDVLSTNSNSVYSPGNIDKKYIGKRLRNGMRKAANFDVHTNMCVLDLEQSDCLLGACDSYMLDSYEAVESMMNRHFKSVKNYIITKSFSSVEKNTFGKWHVWILFHTPKPMSEIKLWVMNSLPRESFKTGLSAVGAKLLRNAILDLAVLDHPNRLIYEHPQVSPWVRMVGTGETLTDKQLNWKYKTSSAKDIHWEPVFSIDDREEVVSAAVERKKKAVGSSFNEKEYREIIDRTRTTLYTDFVLGGRSVHDIIKAGKDCTFMPLIDNDKKYDGKMTYYANTQLFVDHHNDITYYVVPRPKCKPEIRPYKGQYKPETVFKSDTRIALMQSETGSGKTYQYYKDKMCIIIVPTTAMVVSLGGFVKGVPVEYKTNGAMVMTWDKFKEHYIKGSLNCEVEKFTLVVDECHLAGENPVKSWVFDTFTKSNQFKRVVFTSATPSIEAYSPYMDEIVIHKREPEVVPQIEFVEVNNGTMLDYLRTLTGKSIIFLQDKKAIDKYIGLLGGISFTAETAKTLSINEAIKDNDLVFFTSAVREGYSITEHVDNVVMLSTRNYSISPIDAVQISARVRNNLPRIILPFRDWGKHEIEIHKKYIRSMKPFQAWLRTNQKVYNGDKDTEIEELLKRHPNYKQSMYGKNSFSIAGSIKVYTQLRMTNISHDYSREMFMEEMNCYGTYRPKFSKFSKVGGSGISPIPALPSGLASEVELTDPIHAQLRSVCNHNGEKELAMREIPKFLCIVDKDLYIQESAIEKIVHDYKCEKSSFMTACIDNFLSNVQSDPADELKKKLRLEMKQAHKSREFYDSSGELAGKAQMIKVCSMEIYDLSWEIRKIRVA